MTLSKFKKENKELLSYVLFYGTDEDGFVEEVKNEIDDDLLLINSSSYYLMKKTIRKVLRNTKKYIRYSKKDESQVELLLHFCKKMADLSPSIKYSPMLINTYHRQLAMAKNTIAKLHEDLQYDYLSEIENLKL